MRTFAAAWPDRAVLQAPLAELPWYHHLALIEKLATADLRRWYAATAVAEGWSRDILTLKIEGRPHERAGRLVSNFATTLPEMHSDLARQSTKDPYLFAFLTTDDSRP